MYRRSLRHDSLRRRPGPPKATASGGLIGLIGLIACLPVLLAACSGGDSGPSEVQCTKVEKKIKIGPKTLINRKTDCDDGTCKECCIKCLQGTCRSDCVPCGQTCTMPADFDPDKRQAGADCGPELCDTGLVCNGALGINGICVPPGGHGVPCDLGGDTCAQGFACNEGCEEWQCLEPGKNATPCSQDRGCDEAAGYSCRFPRGCRHPCAPDGSCPDGLVCRQYSCQGAEEGDDPKADPDLCDHAIPHFRRSCDPYHQFWCPNGQHCAWQQEVSDDGTTYTEHRCVTSGDVGEGGACDDSSDCSAPLACIASTCRRYCNHDADCGGQACDHKVTLGQKPDRHVVWFCGLP